MSSLLVLSSIALGSQLVMADATNSDYYDPYYYNDSGLSYGARIGIGIGIAVGVLVLCCGISYWRRRQLRQQWAKYRPPTLPLTQTNHGNQNQYANNPPPPQTEAWSNNQHGANPSQPQQTYQPSMAGRFGGATTGAKTQPNGGANETQHEHGYEWEQAREQERLAREQSDGGPPPPGYDTSSPHNDATGYAPPPGPPPTKRQMSGAA